MSKEIDEIEEILVRAGVPKGIHRVKYEPDLGADRYSPENINKLSSIDTFTEATQAIEQLTIEAYKKGYTTGVIDNSINKDALIKEQKLQLLKEVEESVMGAVMIGDIFNSDLFTGYQIILFDGNTEVLRTPIRDKDIPLTEIRTQIIKSIKELREKL